MISIEELYKLFLSANGITIDSRSIQPNSLFFALRGDRFDGNQFALQALSAGCLYAVVDDAEVAQQDSRCLWVEDVLRVLSDLARHHRRVLALPTIAITGTNGKTTTKELIAAVLRRRYKVGATEGNLNNHIGVPLTLLRLQPDHEISVVEMGASHVGEIRQLADIAQPDYALITNIGRAHLEGFGSYEGVIQAKSELFECVRKHGGKAFLHSDDPILLQAAKGISHLSYGRKKDATIWAEPIPHPEGYFLAFRLFHKETSFEVYTRLVGEYNLPNALAAATVGVAFEVPMEEIVHALEAYNPTNNRSQFIPVTPLGNELIVDAYNANPTSMRIAVDNFVQLTTNLPKVIVLGDMYELGPASAREHRLLAEYIAHLSGIEKVFFIGTEFHALCNQITAPHVHYFSSREEFVKVLSNSPLQNRFILLKASNSMRFSSLVELC